MIEKKISHEVPLNLLEESLDFNDYDYCLPLFYERYEKYRNFYLNSSRKGRFIILDNGLFEGKEFTEDQLLSLIHEIQPDIFIIPDVWNDATQTYKNAKFWTNTLSHDLPHKTKLMGVIQGTDLTIGSMLYQQYCDLGLTHISFNHSSKFYNNLFPHKNELVSKMMGRIFFINNLINKRILLESNYHHLLGCSLPQEFMYYQDYDFIKSVDTSNPIIFGLLGKIYNSEGMFEKPKEMIETFMEWDKEQIENRSGFINYNVNRFRHFVNYNKKQLEVHE